jgi:apyrase
VIDASSSASWLQIYQWRSTPDNGLPEIQVAPYPRNRDTAAWEKKVSPGLGDYAERPAEAARSLEPLLEYALERIGDDEATLSQTSVYLRATAGLRLLSPEKQEQILESVRSHFAELPFGSFSARVISGVEEGVFGWIAVNFILGHLSHGGPFPTVGALDLGGASTQITFLPLDHPRSHGQQLRLGENTYHLYTHSYLGLGQDQARERVASPACFLVGYPIPGGGIGTGDFRACRGAIREVLADSCSEGPCSLFGVYQPPVYGEFLAFSVYAYAADFFGLAERLSPSTLEATGSRFCQTDWRELVASDSSAADNPFLPNYCFTAAYVVTLLTDGYGFPPDTDRIRAPLRVQGAQVGWTLGALLYELAGSLD